LDRARALVGGEDALARRDERARDLFELILCHGQFSEGHRLGGGKGVVRQRGFEPPQGCPCQPLKLVRLPVPPLPRLAVGADTEHVAPFHENRAMWWASTPRAARALPRAALRLRSREPRRAACPRLRRAPPSAPLPALLRPRRPRTAARRGASACRRARGSSA